VTVNWTQQKVNSSSVFPAFGLPNPSQGSEGAMIESLRNQNVRNLSMFQNKSPRWSPELNAYVLSFGGRVSMTSVKNFQLVSASDPDTVLLQVRDLMSQLCSPLRCSPSFPSSLFLMAQFGRVSKDLFTLDFQWPFSPLQAFAVALGSFDTRVSCL
jgi:tubby and related proteins